MFSLVICVPSLSFLEGGTQNFDKALNKPENSEHLENKDY